jgi:transcriptional regulator with XRE-family HTH domain
MKTNARTKQSHRDQPPRSRRHTRRPQLQLKTAREAARLTQEELAVLADCDHSLISHLENGTRNVAKCRYGQVCRIVLALNGSNPMDLFPVPEAVGDR